MQCPYCGSDNTNVKDSRPAEDGNAIRRRRQCERCGARFTTYERVQLRELTVKKASGKEEPFERKKLLRSLKLALRKRPVEEEQIELAANSIIRQLETAGENTVTTHDIGQKVMVMLYNLDKVGYVRYASVYHDFNKTEDFNAFIEDLHRQMKMEE